LLIFQIIFPLFVAGALVLPVGTLSKVVMANIGLGVVSIYLLVTNLDQRPAYFLAQRHVNKNYLNLTEESGYYLSSIDSPRGSTPH
jgi:hypothetical protein